MSMTPEQRRKFNELLGQDEKDTLCWDELPVSIKRILLFAAGIPASLGHLTWTWKSFNESERQRLNRAAQEFIEWSQFARDKLSMAQTQTGVAA